jgi:tetratricopeptide (TPR) repeat protein
MRVLPAVFVSLSLVSAQWPPGSRPGSPPGQPSKPGSSSPTSRVRSATGDALDRYAGGAYAEAIAKLNVLGGFNAPQADAWARAQGPSELARRRLLAATLALEYTASRPGLSPALLEWARDTVQATGSAEWERLWLRAAIALAEGAEAWTFLTPSASEAPAPSTARAGTPAPPPPPGYLAVARTRYPDDPYFKLAAAVGLEVASAPEPATPLSRRSPGPVTFDRVAGEMLDEGHPPVPAQAALVEKAAAAFEALAADPTIGAEALVRLGFCRLRLGQRDRALQHFADALRARPARDVSYLAQFFSGVALARSGRAEEAAAAYRAALDVQPRTRSASALLTSLLFMHHKLDDAEAVAEEFLSNPPADRDPWQTYLLGDYPSYSDLVVRLRDAAK